MNLGPVDGVCRKKHRCLDCLTAQQPVLSGQCRVLLLSSLPVNLFGFHVGSSASVKVSLPSVDGGWSIFATELMWSLPLAAKERRACPDWLYRLLRTASWIISSWNVLTLLCVLLCCWRTDKEHTLHLCLFFKKKITHQQQNTQANKKPFPVLEIK